MKKISIFISTLAVILVSAQPSMANQPPGPHVILAEILILPLTAFLSLLGGAYVIMNRKGMKRKKLLTIIVAFLAIVISGAHEGFGVLVAIIFGIYAMIRALKMVSWGINARSSHNDRAHLVGASSWRLITSGVLLILITVFLTGMAVAFVGFWPEIGQASRERELKDLVAHRMAYARWVAEKEGAEVPSSVLDEIKTIRDFNPPDSRVRIEYSQDRKHFTVYMLPIQRMPFFPFNYLTSLPSYRADETGRIRMIHVNREDHLCPEDAPVVMKVGPEDIDRVMRLYFQDPKG
jgi:hypothetical protein